MINHLKLRLVFKSKYKKNKEVTVKINLPHSKHLGFINFVNLALNKKKPVTLTFERVGDSGDTEELNIEGIFEFQTKGA